MSAIQLNTCPICGCFSRFEYGGAMDSGKRIVKVRCGIGCVEQIIFYCEEADAAKAWNFRASTPEFRDLLEALRGLANECELAGHGTDKDYDWPKVMKAARDAIAKATGA